MQHFSFRTLLLLLLLVGTTTVFGQTTVTIGTQEVQSGTQGISPYNYYWESRRVQFVYTAAEIAAAGGSAGVISQISFNVSQVNGGTLANYQVRMAHTTATNAASHNTATLTTVRSSANLTAGSTGWRDIPFTTNFTWNGTSNLLVDVCWGVNSGYSSTGQVWMFNSASNGTRGVTSSTSTLCGTNVSTSRTYKPQVRFLLTPSCTAPTTQASGLTTGLTSTTSANVTVGTRGNGNSVLIVAYPGTSAGTAPTTGNSYTANAAYGSGTALGTGYVVYSGNGTAPLSVNVTGLTAGAQYTFAAYEYNTTGMCFLGTAPNTTTLGTVLTNPASPWVVPAGVSSVIVQAWGGGGGSGGVSVRSTSSGTYCSAGSGGGGGGAYAQSTLSVVAGQSYTVSVGAAGTAGAASGGGNGGDGGSSTFSGTGGTVTAVGGTGGTGTGAIASTGAQAQRAGGAGGVAASGNGTIKYSGGAGGFGAGGGSADNGGGGGSSAGTASNGTAGANANNTSGAKAGGVAPSGGGNGGNGASNTSSNGTSAGTAGSIPGGGGGGSVASTTGTTNVTIAGTAGGQGRIIITYFSYACNAPTVAATTAATMNSCLSYNTGGNVTADGGCPITSRGVCYATSTVTTTPTTANSVVTATGTTGAFTSTISGLAANTTYYVRAFATNSSGTTYGTAISFTTGPVPGQPAAITPTTACAGKATTFTTSATNSPTSFSWTLPGGWTGSSTAATISATPNSTGGNISVTATNGCGTSAARVTAITLPAPVAPTISNIINP